MATRAANRCSCSTARPHTASATSSPTSPRRIWACGCSDPRPPRHRSVRSHERAHERELHGGRLKRPPRSPSGSPATASWATPAAARTPFPCAAGNGDQVITAATMAGAGPPDGPKGFDRLAKSDIQMLKLARKRPALARLLMRVLVAPARRGHRRRRSSRSPTPSCTGPKARATCRSSSTSARSSNRCGPQSAPPPLTCTAMAKASVLTEGRARTGASGWSSPRCRTA